MGGHRERLLAGLPVTERRLHLAGVSTAVLEGGTGASIVLLHGPGEFAGKWRRVIPDLVKTHRVIAPDLPGHGASTVLDSRVDADGMLAWLGGLIERSCPSPPTVVGHLLGGAIAARFGISRGDRLGRLVLVDSLGLAPFRPRPRFALAMIGFLARPTEGTYTRFMRQCSFDLDKLRDEMGEHWEPYVAYNLELACSPSAKVAGRLMREFGLPRILPDDLARIAVPTALIWGRQDRANTLRIAETASARYDWALHVIEDCADDPPRDRPEAFLEALRAVLGPSARQVAAVYDRDHLSPGNEGGPDLEPAPADQLGSRREEGMYDAIVVGARCAGSPTAMLLARKGYRVLLVDKASFPSDTVSTHIVWPHGAEVMDRWGLLEKLAATGCPPIALKMVFDLGPFALRGAVTDANGGKGGFCPRRTVLDKLLVDAAVESGAELREGFGVEELLWADDRVVGLKGRSRNGGSIEERSRIVIGADGVHSLVARAVAAQEYDVKPPLTTFYYSYYSGFEAEDLEQYVRDYQGAACFPTHDGLTLIAAVWPSARFPEVRSDIEGHVKKVHESTPSVAERLKSARREEKWVGTAGIPNYFRKPYGPGWALVGDAGYERDPLTAQGISDAFIDAELLSEALHGVFSGARPFDAALAELQSRRDQRVKPMYEFTCQLATLAPPPPPMRQLFGALHGNQEATNQFYSALTGSLPLPKFMNPENLGRIIASAGGH